MEEFASQLENFFRDECSSIQSLLEEVESASNEDDGFAEKERYLISQSCDYIAFMESGGIRMNYASRVAILCHLKEFDIDFSFLFLLFQENRFDLPINKIIEMIRILDILGAETQLKEYEILFYFRKEELKTLRSFILPASLDKRFGNINKLSLTENVCRLKSSALFHYFLNGDENIESKEDIENLTLSNNSIKGQFEKEKAKRAGKQIELEGNGMKIFRNAVEYFK
jgi:hypothetical protein